MGIGTTEMINRRQILTGSVAVLATSTLPATAHTEQFEPLYTRVTSVDGSKLYYTASAIRRMVDGKTVFFGVVTNKYGKTLYFEWREYPLEKISISGLLVSGNEQLLNKNMIHYIEHGFTVAKMPQDMRKIHDK